MDNQIPNKNILLIILVSFFLLFVVSGVLLFTQRGKKTQIGTSPTVAPTIVSTKGFLKLTTVNNLTRFPVNQPVALQLLADSAGEEIVGFDVLLTYDQSAFDFIKVISLLPDFKVYSYKREGYLSLTIVKSLQSKVPSVFKQTPVLTFNFIPKTPGEFAFLLKEKIGKETTGLMTNKTERLTPALEGLKIKIHQ